MNERRRSSHIQTGPISAPPKIDEAPEQLPAALSGKITEMGAAWRESQTRPRPTREVAAAWGALVDQWARDAEMPLLIRKAKDRRGQELVHKMDRRIVVTDNSPAHWATRLALAGIVPSLDEIRQLLEDDKIPMQFAIRAADRPYVKYRCTLGKYSVGNAGWKLCHIEPVGLNTQKPIEEIAITVLETAFRDLVNPANHFLVPKDWGGIEEVPEFIAEMQRPAPLP